VDAGYTIEELICIELRCPALLDPVAQFQGD
jgi:hypothetical protein